jgi:hypothetical protein
LVCCDGLGQSPTHQSDVVSSRLPRRDETESGGAQVALDLDDLGVGQSLRVFNDKGLALADTAIRESADGRAGSGSPDLRELSASRGGALAPLLGRVTDVALCVITPSPNREVLAFQ